MTEATAALDRVWRAEAGSMLGVLSRRLGDLDLAEDALQDAVGAALRHWRRLQRAGAGPLQDRLFRAAAAGRRPAGAAGAA
ncbi:hypothetical protein ACWEVO_27260, partial [Micromonospora sp. NPDC003776]